MVSNAGLMPGKRARNRCTVSSTTTSSQPRHALACSSIVLPWVIMRLNSLTACQFRRSMKSSRSRGLGATSTALLRISR